MGDFKSTALPLAIIIGITLVVMYLLPLTGYLRAPQEHHLVGWQLNFIFAFVVFNIITIGLPFWIHWMYISDYGKIKSRWFFAVFGGVTGAILGEVLPKASLFNLVMIIPYTILCLIYAKFYSKFTWWKVAATSYLGGIFVENIINRAPIQIPTLMWIGFFTYPYFWTKIWENRDKIPLARILKGLTKTTAIAIAFSGTLYYLIESPPIIVLAAILPFIVKAVKASIHRAKAA